MQIKVEFVLQTAKGVARVIITLLRDLMNQR